jgi:hypothetical protein
MPSRIRNKIISFTRGLFGAAARPRNPFVKSSAKSLLLAAVLGTASLEIAPLHAQRDASPLDPASALTELEQLEKTHSESSENRRRKALGSLRQGSTNGSAAVRLYEEAVEATSGPGEAGRKKENTDLLRDKAFQQSLILRWRYLLLSLESAEPKDSGRQAEGSLEYARALGEFLTAKDYRQGPDQARKILQIPLAQDPFVRWQRLSPLLPAADAWEQVPGNLTGILEKNVRAPWRKSGDVRLEAAWQLELSTGAALAEAGSPRNIEDFNTATAPVLLFRRALDRATAGQPHRAAADILDLARRHPTHPEFPAWASALRTMLQSGGKTASPSPPTP